MRSRCATRWVTAAIAFVTACASLMAIAAPPPPFADVRPDRALGFPRDHGAHPDFRSEWWYVTGWLRTSDGDDVGFQVTFFRARVPGEEDNPSRFAAKQLLSAHAAIADRKAGKLLRGERIARAGFGVAEASVDDANVRLDRWRFVRVPDAADPGALHFTTKVDGDGFVLDLDLRADGPPLAQGADPAQPGYSQKGPSPLEASYYYSVPQMTATGTLVRTPRDASGAIERSRSVTVTGKAWLDREWSSAYLNPQAVGWDWIGINLDDGGALMAFQMRDHRGLKLWAGGARRFADGRIERYRPDDVTFSSLRIWTSPLSGALWPVVQSIRIEKPPEVPATWPFTKPVVPASGDPTPIAIVVEPMMDNQEQDSRATTGTIYWEGAVRARADDVRRSPLGRGYLEMTGYWRPMRF